MVNKLSTHIIMQMQLYTCMHNEHKGEYGQQQTKFDRNLSRLPVDQNIDNKFLYRKIKTNQPTFGSCWCKIIQC